MITFVTKKRYVFIFRWGRRWPTFCFFLTAEVCLLASVAVKLGKFKKFFSSIFIKSMVY